MNHYAALARQGPLLGMEPFRAAMEFAWRDLASPAPPRNGDGHPVVIFPGLGADGNSVTVLRDHCRALGYTAFDWGQGFNIGPQGPLDTWLQGLAHRVAALLAGHAKPATLIGWSLGGLYARELGKLLAPRVRQVITIGTPFNPDAAHPGWLLRWLGGVAKPMDAALGIRLRTPPAVAHHIHLQPLGWRGRVAGLPPPQAVPAGAGHRGGGQPHRHGLEPGRAACRG